MVEPRTRCTNMLALDKTLQSLSQKGKNIYKVTFNLTYDIKRHF
jgi:hypothetical protein